jgi:hypothetical protein
MYDPSVTILHLKALAEVDPVDAAALKLILLTGQRPGEVAHMAASTRSRLELPLFSRWGCGRPACAGWHRQFPRAFPK